jgi:hypothetical protein
MAAVVVNAGTGMQMAPDDRNVFRRLERCRIILLVVAIGLI